MDANGPELSASPNAAVVRRLLPAPPDVVYGQWLDAEALADFMRPTTATTTRVQCDPRLGGRLMIMMIDPESVTTVMGEYLELNRPDGLKFTWTSDYRGGFDSVVTISLESDGREGTLMTIGHELPQALVQYYEYVWNQIAERLDERFRTPT